MPELIALSYSPWSEKARWALDHHRVDYRETEHLIMLGEPVLRWKARKYLGRVSVPTLVDGDRVYTDSFEIARYAEWFGKGAPLLDDTKAVTEWNAKSERALAAGRVVMTERLAGDAEAKREHLPPFVPRAFRPALTPVASLGVAFIRRKYDFDHVARARTHLEATLGELRDALGGRRYILDDFSYADIAMAVVLHFIAPIDRMGLGPATRRCWTQPDLATEFADLIDWRDTLYTHHRVA